MQAPAARCLRSCVPPSRLVSRPLCSSPQRQSHVGSQPIAIPAGVQVELVEHAVLQSHPGAPSSSRGSAKDAPLGRGTTARARASSLAVRLTGPLGTQEVSLPQGLSASLSKAQAAAQATEGKAQQQSGGLEQQRLLVTCEDPSSREHRSRWGLTRALAANAVKGVSEGFELPVRLVGVGYRAAVEDIQQQQAPTTPSPSSPSPKQQLVLRLGYPRPIRLAIPPEMSCKIASPTEIVLGGQDPNTLGQFAAKIRGWRKPEPYNGKGVFVGNETIRRKEVKKK